METNCTWDGCFLLYLQSELQLCYLVSQLLDEMRVLADMHVHVNYVSGHLNTNVSNWIKRGEKRSIHLCLNVLRTIGIFKSVVGIFVAGTRGTNVGNHNCAAVAT